MTLFLTLRVIIHGTVANSFDNHPSTAFLFRRQIQATILDHDSHNDIRLWFRKHHPGYSLKLKAEDESLRHEIEFRQPAKLLRSPLRFKRTV